MPNNIIDKIRVSGTDYTLSATTSGVSVVEATQAEYDALPSSAKTDTSKMYVITDAEAGDLTNYYTKTETNTLLGGKADTATTYTKTEVDNAITAATSTKQNTLVSGTNIKTINNESILGSGNIDIQGGSSYTGVSGVTINNNNEIYYDGIYKTWLTSNHSNDYAVYWFRGRNEKIWISDTAPTSSNMHWLRTQFSFGGVNNLGSNNGAVAFGQGINISGFYASSFGQYNDSKNQVEFSVGQYNTSSTASTTFGDSGNTLFSVGNGTADNARHNAFEIRQNGDIYLSSGGTDIKLQDYLGGGGSITVDSTLDSGSTNPVENQALYDELRIENAPVETTLTFRQPVGEDDYWTTNYPSGCTTLVGNILAYSTQIELYNNSIDLGGFMINCYEGVLDSVSFWGIEGTYSISGSVVTISYPNVTNVTRFRIREDEYQPDYQTYKAMATVAPTVLKNQVNDNTTALGGLKLQQISQSDYENLPTKDSSTLYIII